MINDKYKKLLLSYQIKNTETTVEELAICIKDQKESAENL